MGKDKDLSEIVQLFLLHFTYFQNISHIKILEKPILQHVFMRVIRFLKIIFWFSSTGHKPFLVSVPHL
jgi:hypothetical protein